MKIIGWERKGNVVKFALGDNHLKDGVAMIGMILHMNIMHVQLLYLVLENT